MNNIVTGADASKVDGRQDAGYRKIGLRYHGLVKSFADQFGQPKGKEPIKAQVKDFDLFLAEFGLVQLPAMEPVDPATDDGHWRPKDGAQSDAWIAHCTRRYRLLGELNKSFSHRRVREELNLHPFHVSISHGEVVIRLTQDKVVLGELSSEVERVVKTKKSKVLHLMRSSDFDALSPTQQDKVETLLDAIEKLERDVQSSTEFLTRQYNRLRLSFESAVKTGRLHPKNGGLIDFVNLRDEEEDASESALHTVEA